MRKLILVILCCCFLGHAQSKNPGERFILAFEIKPNDLELSRLAQPYQYFDKIGKRAGLMGYESGTFEAWVWPWKPLRNFELSFLLGTSTQPILAKDIVRTISVTPEVTTLTYTYESFTVREHVVVPRDEPGAILLLDVHTTQPLTIISGFLPVMQPMWPAGVGGQFSYWDDDVNGYVISEGQWRAMFICGSPAAQQMAAPPAHMFADNPLQFRIDVKPGESDGKYIPIVIAGAIPGSSTKKMNMDSVKATYSRLCKHAEHFYEENYEYYESLRNTTMQVITPDKEFNLAYEWGKVALDNLLITNPNLGTGLVAGFGLSGGGARPGFAWFFGGDAFINSLTMDGYGDFSKVRQALEFTQKWQRQDNVPIRKKNPDDSPKDVGKMAHELSQSDGLCDWWNDYHYGYNHADTTPWYIVAMGDYVRTSGDVEFLRKSWNSVKQAYDWCLSKDSDGDGLMDLNGAGLGALEFGKLVGIYADVYTCGIWVQAVKEMKYMAEVVGDSSRAKQAELQFKKAQPRLEQLFWLDREKYYSYGATEKGEQVHEKTPWSGVAMMFGLLDEGRTAKSIEAFNSTDLCTDWGVRSMSNKSELFDPTNYNYGAVWPFISSFFNTAQLKHHNALSGYQVLQSNIKHVFDHALGVVPEVFSGETNEKLAEGYHHQGFSTTGYMLPIVKGLLGLEVDQAHKEIHFSPHMLPYTSRVDLKHINLGKAGPVNVSMRSDVSLGTVPNQYVVEVESADTIRFTFDAQVFTADSSVTFFVNKRPAYGEVYVPGPLQDAHARITTTVPRWAEIRIQCLLPFSTLSFASSPAVGAMNKSLHVISTRRTGKQLTVVVEGRPGHKYHLGMLPPHPFEVKIDGGQMEPEGIAVTFDDAPNQEFARKEIVITLK